MGSSSAEGGGKCVEVDGNAEAGAGDDPLLGNEPGAVGQTREPPRALPLRLRFEEEMVLETHRAGLGPHLQMAVSGRDLRDVEVAEERMGGRGAASDEVALVFGAAELEEIAADVHTTLVQRARLHVEAVVVVSRCHARRGGERENRPTGQVATSR